MRALNLLCAAALALTAATLSAAPAAAIPAMNTGPFIVFFEWDRDTLTPAALDVLNEVMAEWSDVPGACLVITGHTDRSRSAAYNLQLSRRMAMNVSHFFTHRGIAESAITIVARGETDLRLPTADGVREAQNRRVEVTVGQCTR